MRPDVPTLCMLRPASGAEQCSFITDGPSLCPGPRRSASGPFAGARPHRRLDRPSQTMKIALVMLSLVVVGGCTKDPQSPPPPAANAPIRGAVGDSDRRVMISELVASKACALIKGQFRSLRAPDNPALVTGVLWIRDCKITNTGTKVTFHLAGNGWQWATQNKHKAGGTFVVKQYVKFGMETDIHGALDIAYDKDSHIVSMYFSPSAAPEVTFTPIGDVEVDRKGTWSSIIGALGSAFASSPEEMAEQEATKQGTSEMKNQLADGMAVTINLCTGLSRFNLGRPQKGQIAKADAGETKHVPVEIQPGGLLVFGPQLAGNGMSLQIDATSGGVRVALLCADKAATVAEEFLADRIAPFAPLASAEIRGKGGKLAIKAATCPVLTIVRPLDNRAATFTLQRPSGEIAQSTGGPLIHCPAKQDPPAPSPSSSSSAAPSPTR